MGRYRCYRLPPWDKSTKGSSPVAGMVVIRFSWSNSGNTRSISTKGKQTQSTFQKILSKLRKGGWPPPQKCPSSHNRFEPPKVRVRIWTQNDLYKFHSWLLLSSILSARKRQKTEFREFRHFHFLSFFPRNWAIGTKDCIFPNRCTGSWSGARIGLVDSPRYCHRADLDEIKIIGNEYSWCSGLWGWPPLGSDFRAKNTYTSYPCTHQSASGGGISRNLGSLENKVEFVI